MIALQIKDVKHFMGRLLGTDLLDSFLLEEAVVSTYNTFTIDGRMNRAFFPGKNGKSPLSALMIFPPGNPCAPFCSS